jgi:hypothetical protein
MVGKWIRYNKAKAHLMTVSTESQVKTFKQSNTIAKQCKETPTPTTMLLQPVAIWPQHSKKRHGASSNSIYNCSDPKEITEQMPMKNDLNRTTTFLKIFQVINQFLKSILIKV